MAGDEYLRRILQWRKDMDANLRRENDLLAMEGVFWLKKGRNTLGSSRDSDIIFPKHAPRLLGALELDDASVVTLHLDYGQSALLNGQPIQASTVLKHDQEDCPSVAKFGDLSIVVFHRGDKVGIRLWDNARSRTYPPRAWFPIDEGFRVSAQYTPYPIATKVKVPNVLGEIEDDYVQGFVSFKFQGRACRLDAAELEDASLSFHFQDLTNSHQTYPNGRYLNTEPMGKDGQVFLDFNQAYNPPSAFTQYALCTFAPELNHLKVPVEAGELYTVHK
ncbi:MAG TPA: DUF1684 domain-containing protein [Anaerolineales bacterium]|nr:DUF1684 domain-containing protein [Anaerolineales bacterium]